MWLRKHKPSVGFEKKASILSTKNGEELNKKYNLPSKKHRWGLKNKNPVPDSIKGIDFQQKKTHWSLNKTKFLIRSDRTDTGKIEM